METSLTIPTPDSHLIYGTLNQKEKSDRLIIFVHGLGGHQNEHIFFNGAKFFNNKGYHTFRWNLYDTSEKKARKLRNISIVDNANDIETIVKHFSKIYKKIIVIGHSLGGLAILQTNTKNITTAVLRDGSLYPSEKQSREKEYIFSKEFDCYIAQRNIEILISKKIIEEWIKDKTKILESYKIPSNIICAGKGILKNQRKKVLPILKAKHEYNLIQNASHCFDEEGTEEQLFKETLKYINKF